MFVSFAILPKDFVFDTVNLVRLRMANGFIPSTGRMEPEDVGDEICKIYLAIVFAR